MIERIQIQVRCRARPPEMLQVAAGLTLQQILEISNVPSPKEIIAAVVRNSCADLSRTVSQDEQVYFISVRESRGLEIYRHTAVHILSYAVLNLFGKNILNIGPSIRYNYYFDLGDGERVTGSLLNRIKKEFDILVKNNIRIEKEILPKQEAVRYYEGLGDKNRVELLSGLRAEQVTLYRIENYREFCPGPLAQSTGIIAKYRFLLYPPGFLMVFPRTEKNRFGVFRLSASKKLSKIFLETRGWYKTQGVSSVQELNALTRSDRFPEIVTVSEALHEKRISQIADEITKRMKDIRLVLIAGPSASGKTTFIKRLTIQLKVNGVMPEAISLDNYFVNREKTPKDEHGNYDFECLEALDLDLLNEHLTALIRGRSIQIPQFDFHTGRRKKETVPLRMETERIIMIEGIHGLNEGLTYSVPKEKKFKIYVSALSQLRIDSDHRVTTTDSRLFRRIVRDRLFRNHSGLETLRMWPLVRKGEEKYIFPFQEDADIMFNSALIYETAVLKPFAARVLSEVPPEAPEHGEARRLLALLDYFLEASARSVPKVSIVKEFIGDSVFKY